MNNEEKILSMLEQLQQGQTQTNTRLDKMDSRLDKVDSRLDKMDARLDSMDSRFDKMDARLDKMQEDITDIHERVVKVEVTQEHDVLKGIQLLNEGHVTLDRKLSALDVRTKDVDDIRDNVEVLKHVVRNK